MHHDTPLIYPHSQNDWTARAARDKAAVLRLLDGVLKEDSNAIDVGAHEGSILAEIERRSPLGHHVAVEPLEHLAARLTERFPKASVLNIAASDTSGRAAFMHVTSRPGWSGLKLQQYPATPQITELQVTLERLDKAIPPLHSVAFIKIDVEGAECDVIAGAAGILHAHRPTILFEYAKIHAINYDVAATTPYRLLADPLNYAICHLETLNPLTEAWFEDNFHNAYDTGYGLGSQTNFVAVPAELVSLLC
jgi:FkbM family methyltransferase